MKKVYLQPSIYLHTLKIESQILSTTIKGTASEEHYGGNEGVTEEEEKQKDPEVTPTIGGTGDDNGFILGAPTNRYHR